MRNSRPRQLAALLALALGATLLAATDASPAGAAARTGDAGISGMDAASQLAILDVDGLGGVVTDVRVTLNGLSHTFPDDLDVMLTGPDSGGVVLMSDACGTGDLAGANITFDDDAAAVIPNATACASGSYRPADIDTFGDTEDAFSVAAQRDATLSAFDGTNPNGTWGLQVIDDSAGDPTTLESWTLRFETGPANLRIGGATTSSPYPRTVTVSGQAGTITDVDVRLPGLYHRRLSDIDLLLVGPGGQTVELMSDTCQTGAYNFTYEFDDGRRARSRRPGRAPSGR